MNAFLVMNVIVMAVITDNLGTKNFNAQGWRLGAPGIFVMFAGIN